MRKFFDGSALEYQLHHITAANDASPNTGAFRVPLHGAISRVALSETAFALRQPGYEVDIVGIWSAPRKKASAVQWVRHCATKLQPFAHGVHVNQSSETSEELVRADAQKWEQSRSAARGATQAQCSAIILMLRVDLTSRARGVLIRRCCAGS
jgi:hypothetical protein